MGGRDPHEAHNLWSERRVVGDQMLARLQTLHAQFSAAGPSSGPALTVSAGF